MPSSKDTIDLKKIKTDPNMWMRLATPVEGSDKMSSVFLDKENPFTKNETDSMEKLEKLASEGKLYVREFGRSRHFRKAELKDGALNLGDKVDAKTAAPYDRVLGLLMRASSRYFKWLGWERPQKWFEERVRRYDAFRELDRNYKKEYDSLSDEQKDELKKLRKREKAEIKARKRLEKAEKELALAKEAVDKYRTPGEEKTDEPEKQPGKEPPADEAKKDGPEKNIPAGPEQAVQNQQNPEQKKENEAPADKRDFHIVVDGKVYTLDNIQDAPENVRQVLETLQTLVQEMDGKRAVNPDVPGKDQPLQEMDAPLNQPPENERDKVSALNRPKDQERLPLREQLAMEKEDMDTIQHWKDTVARSLFSADRNKALMDQYQQYRDNPTVSKNVLTGAVCGIFGAGAKANGGPENYQKMMESLLSGDPLDAADSVYVQNGMRAFENAWDASKNGNPEALSGMLSDTVREMSRQASQESVLSPRNVMIGKLISNSIVMAQENGIKLNLSDKEMIIAAGAVNMARVTEKYYAARQKLGQGDMDLTSEEGAMAVRDLLAGKAVENGLLNDSLKGEEITSTQILMGHKAWSAENLLQMVGGSTVKKNIKPDEVQNILEHPYGMLAQAAGNKAMGHVINATRRQQKQLQAGNELVRNAQGPEFAVPGQGRNN